VYIFRLTKNRYERLQAIGTQVTSMCFSTLRKSELFVASRDGKICCFDIDSRRLLKTLTGHRHAVNSISFHPFKALMTTSSVESLSVWDIKQWKKVRTLGAGSGVVTSTFTPDGKLLLIAFRDDTVLGWSTKKFENTCRFDVPKRLRNLNMTTLSVSSNGLLLVAGGKSRDIMVWNLANQSPIRSIELPSTVTQIMSVDFLPNSTTCSVLADDGRVRLMDMDSVGEEFEGRCSIEHTIARRDCHVLSTAYDTNGKFSACCVSDGSLLLYDLSIARDYTKRVREARLNMGSAEGEVVDTLPVAEGEEELSMPRPPRFGGGTDRASGDNGGEQVTLSSPPQSPNSKRIVIMEEVPDSDSSQPESSQPESSQPGAPATKIPMGETKSSLGRGGVDDGDIMDGISFPRTQVHTKKDEQYWLEQSMPVQPRRIPTSEVLEEAFGEGPSSIANQVLRKQRTLQQRQRRQMPSPSSAGIGGVSVNGNLSRSRLAKLLRT
jgi:hypothetical protein